MFHYFCKKKKKNTCIQPSYVCAAPSQIKKGLQNPALRRKATSMEQITPTCKQLGDSTDFGKSVTISQPSAAYFCKINHRHWKNPSPTLEKYVTDFGEIRHRLWGNPTNFRPKRVTETKLNATFLDPTTIH